MKTAKSNSLRKGTLSLLSYFLLLAFLNLMQGCLYYRSFPENVREGSPRIAYLYQQGKVFLIHSENNVWYLNQPSINEGNTELRGVLTPVYYPASLKPNNKPGKARPYKRSEMILLNEVHVYTSGIDNTSAEVSIPFSSIRRLDVNEHAKDATIINSIFIPLGIIAGFYGILMLVYLLTKTSCPFVYTFDGEEYAFAGEIFSGATQPGLERHDYLLLPELLPDHDDHYRIRITNEVKEIQHINLLELLVIDHPADVGIIMDKYGQAHTIAEAITPLQAEAAGNDVLHLVAAKDHFAYPFHEADKSGNNIDELLLSFPGAGESRQVKLIIRARNSAWLEKVFYSFHEMFGKRFQTFTQSQAHRPAQELLQEMLAQEIPLSVYLENNGEWEFLDYFNLAGPMALKDDILLLDLPPADGDLIRLKLQTGLMFWELDYVALDYSANTPLVVTHVTADQALDENQQDLLQALLHDDSVYYSQPIIGNRAELRFAVPEKAGETRTLILHSKGYYTVLRDFKGLPRRKALQTFRQPGRLPQYSSELFQKVKQQAAAQ